MIRCLLALQRHHSHPRPPTNVEGKMKVAIGPVIAMMATTADKRCRNSPPPGPDRCVFCLWNPNLSSHMCVASELSRAFVFSPRSKASDLAFLVDGSDNNSRANNTNNMDLPAFDERLRSGTPAQVSGGLWLLSSGRTLRPILLSAAARGSTPVN